jgi:hypothetical protein
MRGVFSLEGHHRPMRTIILAALTAAALLPCPSAAAAGTGFDPRVVTFGPAREQIKSTPIEQRPYRPLHVYGNTIRRRHARGSR